MDPIHPEYKLDRMGHLLRGHSNFLLVKFFETFYTSNNKHITKLNGIINYFISTSKDSLKKNKGTGLITSERDELRSVHREDKDHIVTAVNNVAYLARQGFMTLDSTGKKLQWNLDKMNIVLE